MQKRKEISEKHENFVCNTFRNDNGYIKNTSLLFSSQAKKCVEKKKDFCFLFNFEIISSLFSWKNLSKSPWDKSWKKIVPPHGNVLYKPWKNVFLNLYQMVILPIFQKMLKFWFGFFNIIWLISISKYDIQIYSPSHLLFLLIKLQSEFFNNYWEFCSYPLLKERVVFLIRKLKADGSRILQYFLLISNQKFY